MLKLRKTNDTLKALVLLCCFCMVFPLSAQIPGRDLDGLCYKGDSWSMYQFEAGKIIIDLIIPETGKTEKIESKYSLKLKNMIPFLKFTSNGQENEWLCLYSSDVLFLYAKNASGRRKIIQAYAPETSNREERFYFNKKGIQTGSFLKEGNVSYPASNLGNRDLDSPWVEGVKGYGIGEKIRIDESTISNMYICNGYVSYEKPWLYEMNGRLKTIRIIDEMDKSQMTVSLKDTPNPQKISFGEQKSRKLVIEIIEVYEGSRYEDTCVHFILFEA